jgi:hypothetical protein
VRSKFDRLDRAAGAVSGFAVHAKQHGVVTRGGRQAFEAYLAKMRFVTGQPSGNSR